MISNHIGLLSAATAALGPASYKPVTPTVASPCSVSSRTDWRTLPASVGLLSGLLITDNTLGAAVNPGFCETQSGSYLVGAQAAGPSTVLE